MIPAQAVEAAAKALADQSMTRRWDDLAPMVRRIRLKKMALALEAAAPHMQPDLLEEWAVQFGICGLEEAEDKADAEQKLAAIRESIQNGMDSHDLEPMTVVRRYRIFETELTEWKAIK